jgi:hypothetical protein
MIMFDDETIQRDLQNAMRTKDMERVYVLRGLVAAIKNMKIDKQVQRLPDADLTAIVRKEINKRVEAIGFAKKAGRAETAEQNRRERLILEEYLPAQLGRDELEQKIKELSAGLGTTQIGPLMAELRKRYAGQFDGKLASELIKSLSG